MKIAEKILHSLEFLQILNEGDPKLAIKAITHSKPILVFWVSPDGAIVDAKEAHHDNPPNGDRSVLSDKTHKGYMRGRVAYIGDVVYIVIYGEDNGLITKRQQALLRRSYPRVLNYLKTKDVPQDKIDSAVFIDERGETINV